MRSFQACENKSRPSDLLMQTFTFLADPTQKAKPPRAPSECSVPILKPHVLNRFFFAVIPTWQASCPFKVISFAVSPTVKYCRSEPSSACSKRRPGTLRPFPTVCTPVSSTSCRDTHSSVA
jgi:hypothetical protein